MGHRPVFCRLLRELPPPGSKYGRLKIELDTFGMSVPAVLILAAIGTVVLVGLGLIKLLSVRRLYRAAWNNCLRQDKTWSWRRARREVSAIGNLYLGSVLLVAGASVALAVLVTGIRLVSNTDLLYSKRGYLSDEASGEVATTPGLMMWALCILVGYGLTARFQVDAITHYRRRLRKRSRRYIEVDERRLRTSYLKDTDDDAVDESQSPAQVTR